MSRVINPDNAGKERDQLSKAVALAVRELIRKTNIDEGTRDLAAFISIALLKIDMTIDASVQAWEKRGYWVKADKFRMEWFWAKQMGEKMKTAVLAEDWGTVAAVTAQVGQRLGKIKIAQKHRLGEPWIGAYKLLMSS